MQGLMSGYGSLENISKYSNKILSQYTVTNFNELLGTILFFYFAALRYYTVKQLQC